MHAAPKVHRAGLLEVMDFGVKIMSRIIFIGPAQLAGRAFRFLFAESVHHSFDIFLQPESHSVFAAAVLKKEKKQTKLTILQLLCVLFGRV